MFRQLDGGHSTFEGTLIKIPPNGMPHDPQEHIPVIAGYGSCRSCSCSGYVRDNSGSARCECKHSFSQHRD